jgi:hypothetical protein
MTKSGKCANANYDPRKYGFSQNPGCHIQAGIAFTQALAKPPSKLGNATPILRESYNWVVLRSCANSHKTSSRSHRV